MTKLLRQLHNKLWADAEERPEWQAGDCPPKIVSDLVAAGGLSAWLIEDGWDPLRTLSAIAMSRSKVDDVHYVLIEQSVLKGFGIGLDGKTPGNTVDAEVNKTHRDLDNISARRLIDLASHIRSEAQRKYVNRIEILDAAKTYFLAGKFNLSTMITLQIEHKGTLLKALASGGILRCG